jgi:hypothetical protein
LGQPDPEDCATLDPIYEFRTAVTPQGIARQVVPVLFYDVKRLRLDGINATIYLNQLPIHEVETLQKAVADCDKAMIELRAQQSGLALPVNGGVTLS